MACGRGRGATTRGKPGFGGGDEGAEAFEIPDLVGASSLTPSSVSSHGKTSAILGAAAGTAAGPMAAAGAVAADVFAAAAAAAGAAAALAKFQENLKSPSSFERDFSEMGDTQIAGVHPLEWINDGRCYC